MVTALDRKLLRDMARMRGQLLAIVLVVACGVASYVSMLSVHASLSASASQYFGRHRLPHVFAPVPRTPEPNVRWLRQLPDVVEVETRIVHAVTLDVPGLPEPANGRMIGVSETGQSRLSKLYLAQGRWLTPGRGDEVLAAQSFAIANGLEPGDHITAIIEGRQQTLEIVGIALSPEYVFQIAPGTVFPDDRHFGVLWMGREALAAATDMDGAFNEVVFSLGDPNKASSIVAQVDELLEGSAAYDRDKQTSYLFVKEELKQLESLGAFMPTLFLGVAAFLLNVVISRLVGAQREQIAALKALGYRNFTIGLHYIKLVVVIAVAGTFVGTVIGAWLGRGLIGLYHGFFRFPALVFRLELSVVWIAGVLTLVAGVLGTFRPVRRAVSVAPAEAMRPAAPERYRRSILEILGLTFLLAPPGRIVLRNIARHPARLISSTVGIACAIAILISGNFGADALDVLMRVSFQTAQRDDMTVTFIKATGMRAIDELRHIPGVLYAEPTRDVGVRFRAGSHTYSTAIVGLPAEGRLRRVIDMDTESPVALPKKGLLMNEELGRRLDVRVGDIVDVELLEDDRRHLELPVEGFVKEMVGMTAYMDIDAVHTVLEEGSRATGARLLLDPNQTQQVYVEIKRLPGVAGATLRTAAIDMFMETSGNMQRVTGMILVLFAGAVAVGVIYNGARILLAERSRELASLRVLGFTRVEISVILLGELGLQLLLAVPIGCGLGYLFVWMAMQGLDTEVYRFPVVVSSQTYAFAVSVVLSIGVITALVVRRALDRLDLVAVLKTRE